MELAISTTPEDDPYQVRLLNGLGNMLSAQYKRTENMHDLEAAILKAELAVSTTPKDHPCWKAGNYMKVPGFPVMPSPRVYSRAAPM